MAKLLVVAAAALGVAMAVKQGKPVPRTILVRQELVALLV
jgi:hypothetical protein